MTTLDKARLEAAVRAIALADLDPETRAVVDLDAHLAHVRDHYEELASVAILAYLSALPAEPVHADVAEMARALREWPGDGQRLRDEAASMLTRVAAEKDAARAEASNFHQGYLDADDATLAAEARLEAAEASNANLFRIISDIREASGLGARPMLNDIAGEIGRIVAANTAAEAALAEARRALEPFAMIARTEVRADEKDMTKILVRIGFVRAADRFLQSTPAPAQHEGEKG